MFLTLGFLLAYQKYEKATTNSLIRRRMEYLTQTFAEPRFFSSVFCRDRIGIAVIISVIIIITISVIVAAIAVITPTHISV